MEQGDDVTEETSHSSGRKVSVAFPVYDEEANLEALYRGVRSALLSAGVDYELVFVDNGSTDSSLDIIKRLRTSDDRVRWVSLSRNFGHQGGLFAGMSVATGEAVITMDADLQHPPELIPKMIELWLAGNDIVYTTKRSTNVGIVKRTCVRAFYRLMSVLSGIRLEFGQSDFRLVDRKALDALLSIPEYHKFLRGQVGWIGFRQTGFAYDVRERGGGRSKFSYRSLFSLAFDGVFAFSRYPLRLIALLGVSTAALAMVYLVYVIGVWLTSALGVRHGFALPAGWATTIAAVLLMGSVQLVAIGVLGEYVGRVFDQTKGRPVFIVRESSG